MNEFIATIKKYAVFKGRASRREFWIFILGMVLVLLSMITFFVLIGFLHICDSSILSFLPLFMIICYCTAFFIPHIAVSVRRLHDIGRSGLLLLPPLIPPFILGLIAVLAIKFSNGHLTEVDHNGIDTITHLIGFYMLGYFILFLILFCKKGNSGNNRYGQAPKSGTFSQEGKVQSDINMSITMQESDGYKTCPFCGETIKSIATKCKHCGEFLSR